MWENLSFGSTQWLPAAATAGGIAVASVIWSYWTGNTAKSLGWLAACSKALAAALLVFCLLEPLQRFERPLPGANVMAVVVDNSRSMQIRSPGESQSRDEKFRQALKKEAAWQTRLAQDFDMRKFAFDSRLRSINDFAEINFNGTNSQLAEAVRTIQARFARRPIAGIMVMTDGLATDGLQELIDQVGSQIPIYPIVDESVAKFRDISITDPTVMQSAFEIAPVTLEATLRAGGLAGRAIVVKLVDQLGKTIDKQTIVAEGEAFRQRVRFQFKPEKTGFQFVRIQAILASEDREPEPAAKGNDSKSPQKVAMQSLTSSVEVTTANNSRLVSVDRGGGPYRILYVAGRPNWEFKFLRRALEEDDEVDLTGLIRIAKKEPKFSFRDRGVDSANPLFAGFDDQTGEAAEQYDEPVLLRIGVEGEDDLKGGFPKTDEMLFQYEAILLDDVEAEFFSQEQMLLMRRFVAERGGGLMMLGGMESFAKGKYRDTALGDLLPVYLRSEDTAEQERPLVRFRLTREGSLEPWTRLRSSEADEAKRVTDMPSFMTWNSVADVKPGASILAEIYTEEQGTGKPALVTQRFGKGRTAALTIGDFWRWSMRRESEKNDDLAQAWRQVARWLTADVPKRIEFEIEPPKSANAPHLITLQLRDAAFKPMDNASIELTIKQPDDQTIPASVTPDPKRSGVYNATYWSQLDGAYELTIHAKSSDGEPMEPVVTGWTAEPSSAEFANLIPDSEVLRELAKRSGGEVVSVERLDTFVASLPSRKVPITESRFEPLWHKSWMLGVALFCLCLEWAVRRLRGMP